jgi:hypothetical protein
MKKIFQTIAVTIGIAIACHAQVNTAKTAAPQAAESAVSFPKKTVRLKKTIEQSTPQSSSKMVKASSFDMAILDGFIDGDSGWASPSFSTVGITGTGTISALGLTMTVQPDTSLPLSAWKKVACNVKTNYFTTITGDQPNEDNIATTPSLTMVGNSVSFACPYKSSAHALNIAKSIDVTMDILISHIKNGMEYKFTGFLYYSCTRATKTASFTCS